MEARRERQHPGFKHDYLAALIEAPALAFDGSTIDEHGYSAVCQNLMCFRAEQEAG